MKILLIHLSDVHIQGDQDHILEKVDKIAQAARNLDYELAACILVVTGDISFSGSEEQCLLGQMLVHDLRTSLDNYLQLPHKVQCVAIPGNHDCDVSDPTSRREDLLDSIDEDPTRQIPSSDLDVILTAQDNCFDFIEAVDQGNLDLKSRVYYEYPIDFGSAKVIFRCYNTAWMSRKHEHPSRLVFPLELVPNTSGLNFDVIISVFHHPYNWLTPENGRVFREHIQGTSDIIMTGHEHVHTRHLHTTVDGEVNEHIEGGVLQESGNVDVSSFNTLVLDTDEKRQKFNHFVWNGSIYSSSSTAETEWEVFQANRLVPRREFELSYEFKEHLEDPELDLRHGKRGLLKLSDIFVYPNLREQTNKKGDSPRTIKGENVPEHLFEQRDVVVTGPERSGRTSLAKALYKEFYQKGLVPVLVNGASLKPQYDERLYKSIYRAFERQYSNDFLESYQQLDKSKRVIILDDFDRVEVNAKGKERIFAVLKRFSGRTILLANDLTFQMEEVVDGDREGGSLAALGHYKVQQFNHIKRDSLIEKWLLPGSNYIESDAAVALKLRDVHRQLNTILGKNFVPAYPVFILSVLQAREDERGIDPKASTYGYFYEIFIKSRLAAKSLISPDTKIAYLAFVAINMFRRRTQELSGEELRDIHKQYEDLYDRELSYEHLIAELVQARILGRSGDSYKFKYKYIYYYFTASHFSDHITEDETRRSITEMSEKIYVEEYSNILLFLAHLSRHPYIIDQMLSKARQQYSEYSPAELDSDVAFLNDMNKAVTEVAYIEGDPTAARKRQLERIDEAEDADASETDDESDLEAPPDAESDPIVRLDIALKTLRIVGQILKNFTGSLKGEVKARIAKECYQLGLRCLRAIFDFLETNKEEFLQHLVSMMREEHPHESKEELVKRANKTMAGMAHVLSYGMIKKISYAVGSPDLSKTYSRILQEEWSPAVALVDTSTKLDHTIDFPTTATVDLATKFRTNPLALSLLKHLVVSHFDLFPVPTPTKQSVCEQLKIPYSTVKVLDPGRKMISK